MATATKNRVKKPTKPKAEKPKKAAQLLAEAQEALSDIAQEEKRVEQKAREVAMHKQALEEAREMLKGAKADHLQAVKDLQLAIKESTEPSLFNPKAAAPSTNGVHTPPANPEAWKSEPLSTLRDLGGLTQADLDRIEAKTELRTMGDLSKWLSDSRHVWTDLPGIGEKKVEKLQDAMEQFWKKHNHSRTISTVDGVPVTVTGENVKPETDLPAAEHVGANGDGK